MCKKLIGTLFCLILFLNFNIAAIEISQSALISNCVAELNRLNREFTLSNFSAQERKHNLNISQSSYALVKLLTKEIENHPGHLTDFFHLSYKLANFFQQNDRLIDAEIVLNQAFLVIDKKFPQLSTLSSKDSCNVLGAEDSRLPSLYAALLHYRAKSYFYKPDVAQKNSENSLPVEKDLKSALNLRAEIDALPDSFEDPCDSGKGFYSSHTLLFFRTLGYFYLEKGNLISARDLYGDILQSSENPFEKVMAALQLIKIDTQLARKEINLKNASDFYLQAYQKTQFVEDFLNGHDYPGKPNANLVLVEFYLDKENPFYNSKRAQKILENSLSQKEQYSQTRMFQTSKRLGQLYLQLGEECCQESIHLQENLQEAHAAGKISPLLDPAFSSRIEGVIALSKIYCSQKQFLQATLLLANVLSHSRQFDCALAEELWSQLYLVEKEFISWIGPAYAGLEKNSSLTHYKTTIQGYQAALERSRSSFRGSLSRASCWTEHRALNLKLKQIFSSIFEEAYACLRPEQTPFALIGLGSIARGIPSPYSDLEFILVHEETVSCETRKFFEHLSTFFLLRLFSIGETPFDQFKLELSSEIDLSALTAILGARPDAGGILSHSFGHSYKLCGSIKEVLQQASNPALLYEFSSGTWLSGSLPLAQDFQQKAQSQALQLPLPEKQTLFWNDFLSHTTPLIKVNIAGSHCYSIKHSFIRGLILMLRHLGWEHAIFEGNLEKLLNILKNEKILSQENVLQIDALWKQLLYLQRGHYLKCHSQLEDILLEERDLETYLDIARQWQFALESIIKALPYDVRHTSFFDKQKLRSAILCRGGYILKAVQELEESEKNFQKKKLWQLQGDLALIQARPSLAYQCYAEELKENPDNALLNFKLAEAAIYENSFHKAQQHLALVDCHLNSKPADPLQNALKLKSAYLQIVIFRKMGNWVMVEKLLQKTQAQLRKTPLLKQANLIFALIELENGYFQGHLKCADLAIRHLESSRALIVNKYGALHPSLLPIYEELVKILSFDQIGKKCLYNTRIAQIKKLFPNILWCGILDVHQLD